MRFLISQAIVILLPLVLCAPRVPCTEQAPLAENDGIHWKNATSLKGLSFEVGSSHHGDEDREILACKRFRTYWPVDDDSWKYAGISDLSNVISEYKLHDNGWSAWSWRLDLRPFRYGGDFQFYDQSGDCYDLVVATEGEHYIRYNSKSPTIIGVGYGGTCSDCSRR